MNKQTRKTKPKRKRLGRPPGPAGSIRSQRIVTFVTSSEFRQLRRLADESGMSVSALVHKRLVQTLEETAGELAKPTGVARRES